MAKKKSEWAESAVEVVKGLVQNQIKEGFHSLVTRTQDILYHTEKKLVQQLMANLFLFVAIIFVIVAVVLLVIQYLGWSAGWAFLVIGVVLFIFAAAFKNRFDKDKNYKW